MGMQFRELADWVRRRKFFAGVLVMFTLAIGIMIGTLISGRAMATKSQAGNGAALLAIPDPVALSGTFSAIAGKLEPTVVNISTTQVIDRPKGKQKRKPGDPFDDFFDRFFDNQDEGPTAERSLGSGVLVDAKGYILTNNHVVDQATKIEVTIDKDPKHYMAKVIGTDTLTDLAVIKIDSDHALPVARLGNSNGVRWAIGFWLLAAPSAYRLLLRLES